MDGEMNSAFGDKWPRLFKILMIYQQVKIRHIVPKKNGGLRPLEGDGRGPRHTRTGPVGCVHGAAEEEDLFPSP